MRFYLDGQVYALDSIFHLSLGDIIRFDVEAEQHQWPVRWADVERLVWEAGSLPTQERARHRGTIWWVALTIWRAKKDAGETTTFTDLIESVPVMDPTRFRFLDDPPPEPSPDPPKARPVPRKASGRAAAKRRVRK